jgi:hypothetical protein
MLDHWVQHSRLGGYGKGRPAFKTLAHHSRSCMFRAQEKVRLLPDVPAREYGSVSRFRIGHMN